MCGAYFVWHMSYPYAMRMHACMHACMCGCAFVHACVFYMWHVDFVMYIRCVVCFVLGEDIPTIPSRKDGEKDG